MGKGGVHTPDQDYVPEDNCHTCLPLRPGLYLSGQHCTHRGSCPSHSVCLWNDEKIINTKYILKKHDLTDIKMQILQGSFLLKFPVLTISIDVHSTGISLSVVVCVCLVWVTIVGAVVTAVTHIITIIVILPGVVHEWTVVLFPKKKDKGEEKNLRIGFQVQCLSFAIWA